MKIKITHEQLRKSHANNPEKTFFELLSMQNEEISAYAVWKYFYDLAVYQNGESMFKHASKITTTTSITQMLRKKFVPKNGRVTTEAWFTLFEMFGVFEHNIEVGGALQ